MAFDRKEYTKKYHAENRDKIREQHREWDKTNPGRRRKYLNEYHSYHRQNNPLHKLKQNISSLIRGSFKYRNFKKSTKTTNILGCGILEFKQHIESQFEPWMTWDNYGTQSPVDLNVTWDIDHIIPLSTAKNVEDVIELNHYTNLRPLCSYYNRFIKADKL